MEKIIKAFWLDLDGTLTDGMYHVGSNGDLYKSFYTRDFGGLQSLIRDGIQVHILTHSHDYVIDQKIQSLNGGFGATIHVHKLTSLYVQKLGGAIDSTDKGEYLIWWCKNNGIKLHEIAYMGDAEGDISAAKIAGFVGCPADAIDDITKHCTFISKYNGGHGAVWEYCRKILDINAGSEEK